MNAVTRLRRVQGVLAEVVVHMGIEIIGWMERISVEKGRVVVEWKNPKDNSLPISEEDGRRLYLVYQLVQRCWRGAKDYERQPVLGVFRHTEDKDTYFQAFLLRFGWAWDLDECLFQQAPATWELAHALYAWLQAVRLHPGVSFAEFLFQTERLRNIYVAFQPAKEKENDGTAYLCHVEAVHATEEEEEEEEEEGEIIYRLVSVEHETEKALLVRILTGEQEETWIPKSQIDDSSEVWTAGQRGELAVSRWLAEQKDWLASTYQKAS